MAKTLKVEIVGDASSLEKALAASKQSAGGFGAALDKASKGAAVGLVALAVGAKKLSGDASNLGESVNAVKVVFGDASKRVLDFAKNAAREAGLSMRAFNELVTPVGASLRNVGFSADKAASSSIALAKRAADMASVFNVDVSEALGAIQAGLRGEADPLERFGVGLSAAAVEAHALSMGLGKTAADLTENDKAQARLALLMEQTNKVAGDFKNTSDSLANAQRINAAEAENQRAAYGKGLVPVMQTLQALQKSATQFMSEHTTAVKVATIAAAGLAAAVLAVNAATKVYTATLAVARAAQVAMNLVVAANPFVLVAAAVAAFGVALVVAYKKSETFRDVVNGVFGSVKNAVATFIGFVLVAVDKFLGGIQAIAEGASRLPIIGDKFRGVAEAVGNARENVRGLGEAINSLKDKTVTVTTVLTTRRIEILDRIERNRANIPGRAHGGPVKRGFPYVVGEKGAELFVPDAAGRIVANAAAVGRGTAERISAALAPAGPAVPFATRGAAAAPVINVTVNGFVGSDQDIALRIRDQLIRHAKANGSIFVGYA